AEPGPLLALAKEAQLTRAMQRGERTYSAVQPHYIESQQPPESREKENQMATVVSLINMKGGVGQTTLAMQLAHAADRANHRVIAVDLHPQSNLSQALMGPRPYVQHLSSQGATVAQIFDDYVPTKPSSGAPEKLDVNKVVLKKVGYWSDTTLDLIPSRLELS